MTDIFNDEEMQALKKHFDEQTCLNIVESYQTIVQILREQAPQYKHQKGDVALNKVSGLIEASIKNMKLQWPHIDWEKNSDS